MTLLQVAQNIFTSPKSVRKLADLDQTRGVIKISARCNAARLGADTMSPEMVGYACVQVSQLFVPDDIYRLRHFAK